MVFLIRQMRTKRIARAMLIVQSNCYRYRSMECCAVTPDGSPGLRTECRPDSYRVAVLVQFSLCRYRHNENWYRNGISRNVLYTDGAQHVAEHDGAYWLLDAIAIIQPYNKAVAAEEFQVWRLAVRPDRSATLTCDDGNGNIVFTKKIEYTDFPPDEITLYFANNVIHLPSEY
jgi:hypothetical protein